jgi:hypothetical protein
LVILRKLGIEPGEHDFIQSLLRLAPEYRGEALSQAIAITGHVGRIVRWALGSKDGPTKEDGDYRSLWLAAGRARLPAAALSELAAVGIPENLPDGVIPAGYAWQPKQATKDHASTFYQRQAPPIEIVEQPSASFANCPATWPTVVLHDREHWCQYMMTITTNGPNGTTVVYDRMERTWFVAAWKIEWLAQVWPLCLDPFCALAAYELGQRIDQAASPYEPNHVFLKPLLDPDRPWSEMSSLAVAMGLASKNADVRTSALDVLIEAVSDGRAHARQLARVLSKLLAGGWLKLNRVADALAEVARCSKLHTWFAAEALQGFLAGLDSLPRDAHFVLSLLHELLVDLGMALSPAAARPLEAIHGTSKTAKTAAAMRELLGQSNPAEFRQAGLQLLESRIARAKRWSVCPAGHSDKQS